MVQNSIVIKLKTIAINKLLVTSHINRKYTLVGDKYNQRKKKILVSAIEWGEGHIGGDELPTRGLLNIGGQIF